MRVCATALPQLYRRGIVEQDWIKLAAKDNRRSIMVGALVLKEGGLPTDTVDNTKYVDDGKEEPRVKGCHRRRDRQLDC